MTTGVVASWKEHLEKSKKGRVAKALGVPGEDEELFPQWDEWLKLEAQGGAVDLIDVEGSNGEEEEAAAEVPEAQVEAAESDEE